ncbi:MAG: hypothetical protein AMXMBFR84_35620 [Candidatus Hydrogenedentota bacterium]
MSRFLKLLTGALAFLSSYGLATVLFLLLLLLTFLGTVEQTEKGLYETQNKFFGSVFLVHHFFDRIPVVLPGAYLVLSLLSINLLLGGILRIRKGWRQAGILIAHGGIVLLMAWAFITYHYAFDGHMTLYEGERSNTIQSYHDWEIAVTEGSVEGSARQFVIADDRFKRASKLSPASFTADSLPFILSIFQFFQNSAMQPKGPTEPSIGPVVNGFILEPLPKDPKNERNVAGLYCTVEDKTTGERSDGLLWAMGGTPLTVMAGGTTWHVELRRKTWELPFTIVLNDFTRELHPRTSMPRVFKSEVTKLEGNTEQIIQISMNEPLRHRGYTLFQASWGPQDAGPNDRLFSTFAVAKNPADQFPLYACIVIAAGLLIHFSIKLYGYLQKENRRRA